jgi:hypothetical protein
VVEFFLEYLKAFPYGKETITKRKGKKHERKKNNNQKGNAKKGDPKGKNRNSQH